jgi:uncharacterized protein DUF5677
MSDAAISSQSQTSVTNGGAAPKIPDEEARLYAALDGLLRGSVEWLDRAKPRIATIGDRMLLLLVDKILQLGRTVLLLSSQGYAGEAAAQARAMLSACIKLAYIAEDRDGRSIAFMEADREDRRAKIADLERERQKALDDGKEFFVRDSAMELIRDQAKDVEAMEEAKLAALGVKASKLGGAKDWTGLGNERVLFDRMNGLRWYMLFYKRFSEEIHVNARSLAEALTEQVSGTSTIGPKYGDPLTFFVIKASAEAVLHALDQIDQAFSLKGANDVSTLDKEIGAALTAFEKEIMEVRA